MTTNPKYLERIDKENTKVGPAVVRKDKGLSEDVQPTRKKVLGEASNMVFVVEEPTSP